MSLAELFSFILKELPIGFDDRFVYHSRIKIYQMNSLSSRHYINPFTENADSAEICICLIVLVIMKSNNVRGGWVCVYVK